VPEAKPPEPHDEASSHVDFDETGVHLRCECACLLVRSPRHVRRANTS
jgi:hypothetical protein